MTFYTFANATTSIPLANLDANFATPITLGNTAVTINGTFSSIGNLTLNNATIASGNSTVTKETVTTITSPAATNLTIQSAGTTAMTIDTSQNVGIGTTSPSYKLSVNGTSVGGTVWANVNNTDTTAGSAAGFFGSNGGVNAVMYSSSNGATGTYGMTTNHPMLFITNNTERMRIDSSGNLLVGTTSFSITPSQGYTFYNATNSTLNIGHANGVGSGNNYMIFAYNSTSIGGITQNGTTGVLYNITSDQRLKTNIVDAPSASSIIDAIQIRSFDWKSDGSHYRYGVIAQELNQIVPEAVHTPVKDNQMMGVDYSKLVPLLVKEIQELRARLKAANIA